MNLTFEYNKQKDIYCLVKYGAGSFNSKTPTKVYEELVAVYGDNPTEIQLDDFVVGYLKDNAVNLDEKLKKFESDWLAAKDNYIAKAESIFGVTLPNDITVFLTINNRCPYNIEQSYFFVSLSSMYPNRTVMHELWHFYTWYKFGITDEEKLGKQKYNDLKEALTVLLNIEFPDTFRRNPDMGYPQHQELREKILEFWSKSQDMDALWASLI